MYVQILPTTVDPIVVGQGVNLGIPSSISIQKRGHHPLGPIIILGAEVPYILRNFDSSGAAGGLVLT